MDPALVRKLTSVRDGGKNGKKRPPGPNVSAPGSILVDFGVPPGFQNGLFGATFGRLGPTFATFWATVGSHVVFLRSRVLGEGAGLDLGRSRDPPGRNFGTIFGDSLRRSGHWWRPDSALSLSTLCPKFDQLVAPLLLSPPTRPAHQLEGRRSPRSGLNSPGPRRLGGFSFLYGSLSFQ